MTAALDRIFCVDVVRVQVANNIAFTASTETESGKWRLFTPHRRSAPASNALHVALCRSFASSRNRFVLGHYACSQIVRAVAMLALTGSRGKHLNVISFHGTHTASHGTHEYLMWCVISFTIHSTVWLCDFGSIDNAMPANVLSIKNTVFRLTSIAFYRVVAAMTSNPLTCTSRRAHIQVSSSHQVRKDETESGLASSMFHIAYFMFAVFPSLSPQPCCNGTI